MVTAGSNYPSSSDKRRHFGVSANRFGELLELK